MAGGYAKDALGDLLGGLQASVESLKRHSSSGKILPCNCYLQTNGTAITNPPAVQAEYYRHADLVQVWFTMTMPAGFTPGTGAYILQLPWQLKAFPGGSHLVGRWRGVDSSTSNSCAGEIYVIGPTDGRLYFFYVAAPPVGPYQYIGNTTPWTWDVGDVLQGEFQGHVLPGF